MHDNVRLQNTVKILIEGIDGLEDEDIHPEDAEGAALRAVEIIEKLQSNLYFYIRMAQPSKGHNNAGDRR
jgi:hypothetical protein